MVGDLKITKRSFSVQKNKNSIVDDREVRKTVCII